MVLFNPFLILLAIAREVIIFRETGFWATVAANGGDSGENLIVPTFQSMSGFVSLRNEIPKIESKPDSTMSYAKKPHAIFTMPHPNFLRYGMEYKNLYRNKIQEYACNLDRSMLRQAKP